MITRELVNRVRTDLKLLSSDTTISDRSIAFELKTIGIKYLLQWINKRKYINSPNIYVSLPCVDLTAVSLSSCCDYKGDCKIARSKCKIPKIIDSPNFGLMLQGVYSIDGVSRKFKNAQGVDRYVNYKELGIKGDEIFYWVQDNYLYITDPLIEKVSMIAAFEDDIPEHFLGCDADTSCPANPLDEEFRFPTPLVEDIVLTTITNLSKTYKIIPTDESPEGIEQR